MRSCLYVGATRHRRYHPVRHEFRFPLFCVWIDLGELETVFHGRWLWSTRRAAPAWFRREDHFGPADQPLDEAARDLIESRLGFRPSGPVRALTHLRYWGYIFNPVSLFFLYEDDGETLQAVIAEVSNTPWGERHLYVHDARGERGETMLFTNAKEFHVSPFMQMDMTYRWLIRKPGEEFRIGIENWREGTRVFEANLQMKRRPITGLNLARTLLRFPCMTAMAIVGIYWQAARLWWKGAEYHKPPSQELNEVEMLAS